MEKVVIYTDGACSGNPGPGGWGSILMYKENKKEIFGNKENTTNNVMELTAVIEGLKLLKFPCEVDLYSDSACIFRGCVRLCWLHRSSSRRILCRIASPSKRSRSRFDADGCLFAVRPTFFALHRTILSI